MPAIYHEGSWLGNATDPEVLVKDTVGWTGKNLIPFPFPSYPNNKAGDTISQEGISWTINSDNSITATGTGTGNGQLSLASRDDNSCLKLKQGKYIISGCPASLPINIHLGYTNNGAYADVPNSTATDGSESTFEITDSMLVEGKDYAAIAVYLQCRTQTVNNLTFYPMLRRADITDSTYEPYHESVEEEIEQIYADNGVLGAKNLLNPTYAGGTVNGVTITTNENKTYKLNGAPSSGNMAVAIYTGTFPVGRYILNGVPDFTTYGARLHIRETAGASQVDAIDTGKGIEFAIPSATTSYSVFMYLNSGYTANDLIIKPMLRLASDPDDTYQPYAMTNRELTEKAVGEKHTATITTGTTGNWASTHTISAIRRMEAYAKGYIVIPFVNASGTWFLKVLSIDMQPVASQSIEVTYWTFAV